MNINDLERCPFCGGRAQVDIEGRGINRQNNNFYIRFKLRCIGCGATNNKTYQHEFSCIFGVYETAADAFSKAVEDWNTRAYIQEDPPLPEHFTALPCEIGDTVYVYANNRAEETKVKAFKVYDDQILVYTTIGEFDANRVYKNIVDLYANECRETSFG